MTRVEAVALVESLEAEIRRDGPSIVEAMYDFMWATAKPNEYPRERYLARRERLVARLSDDDVTDPLPRPL